MGYLLGLDLATNGVTAVLVKPEAVEQPVIAHVFESHATMHPKPGWVEQDPEQWWQAAETTIRRLLVENGVAGSDISVVGLSGQMHGLVLVDERGRVVRPCMTWGDQRGAEQAAWMLEQAPLADWVHWTGTAPSVGMVGTRLLWVRQEEPELFACAAKMLAPKDFLRLRLTGEYATDVTDASSTLLFNVQARAWSAEACARMGIDRALLPRCYESQEVSGTISIETAEATGLKAGTPVIAGAGNQAAAAMGLGAVRSNEVAALMGSGGVLVASIHSPLVDPELRLQTSCHARRTKWCLVGMTQTAGIAFRWLRDTFCNAEKEVARNVWSDPYNLMTRQAEEVPIGSDGLIFLPYLNGERTPHRDPQARGAFYGITMHHEKPHFIRAVMEGVCFSMHDTLEVVRQTGVPVDRVVMAGGGMQSALWRQMFADVFGVDLIKTNVDNPAPFGAALMATVAAGHCASVEQAVESLVQATDVTEPDPDAMTCYQELFAIYRALYPALSPSFAQTAAFLAEHPVKVR